MELDDKIQLIIVTSARLTIIPVSIKSDQYLIDVQVMEFYTLLIRVSDENTFTRPR